MSIPSTSCLHWSLIKRYGWLEFSSVAALIYLATVDSPGPTSLEAGLASIPALREISQALNESSFLRVSAFFLFESGDIHVVAIGWTVRALIFSA